MPGRGGRVPVGGGAAARARALAAAKAGAVTFARTGDPETGDWADAIVLSRFVDTPSALEVVSDG